MVIQSENRQETSMDKDHQLFLLDYAQDQMRRNSSLVFQEAPLKAKLRQEKDKFANVGHLLLFCLSEVSASIGGMMLGRWRILTSCTEEQNRGLHIPRGRYFLS
ncbi:hypothetical protein CDAR_406531 [Caerostris darwini]|uniref:Uncharacterized protein n=1 Tax=Caerostris darwini TaxID=1538125 RepID=A0AAV4S2K6_9ARAC|nr:hypothetical protein CDAR_406531 [Caerostris darwini]